MIREVSAIPPSARYGVARPLMVLLAALLMATQATGQEPAKEEAAPPRPAKAKQQARLPVRVVAGRLVVRCDLSTRHRRIPVNLFVDFDRLCGLELHNRAAAGLKVDQPGGLPITVHLPGFNLSIDQREHGDEDGLNDFTRLYSDKLGETACVGTIGAKILRSWHVTFDVAAGFVYLEPPHERSEEPPAEDDGSTVTSLTFVNDLAWMPVRLVDGKLMSLALGSSRYDSIVDQDVCEQRGHPAGDIGAVRLKTVDVSGYLAWRPTELVQRHADGALGVLGINFLEHFRVEVDRVNGFARISETVPAKFPAEDLAYFKAMIEEEPEPVLAWLKEHGETRLGREAAELLLTLLLDGAEGKEAFTVALDWMDKTRIEDLRATEALTTMKTLLEARRYDIAVMAGELGIKSGRKDRYPESVHKLHAKLGELLLEGSDVQKSWEHLLSAAFGLPQDGMINLNLGRLYEKQKRYKRAMSRYVQAVIQPESGPQAVKGLERVQAAIGGEPLSVDLVDRMVSGKVWNFTAATKFKPDKDTDTNRVVLAELFTNAHFGRPLKEGWVSFAVGGMMACEGLLSHFPRKRLAVLTWQLPVPEPVALMNPLSEFTAQSYEIDKPLFFMINGVRRGPGAQRWRKAEAVYNANRDLVLEALKHPSEHELTAEAAAYGDVVSGKVVVKGPRRSDLVVQVVLAERGVLYPGKAKIVVQRMVGRASLTGSLEGVPYEPSEGSMEIPFRRSLADVTRENEAFLAEFEADGGAPCSRLSTRIDPRQVSIVAFIRDRFTLEVLQAVQVDAKQAGRESGK